MKNLKNQWVACASPGPSSGVGRWTLQRGWPLPRGARGVDLPRLDRGRRQRLPRGLPHRRPHELLQRNPPWPRRGRVPELYCYANGFGAVSEETIDRLMKGMAKQFRQGIGGFEAEAGVR